MGVPHSIRWGLGVGIGSFLSFFAFEYSIERGQERKGNYTTLTPFKRRRDMKTGQILQDNEDVDFDPRHGLGPAI
jgi:xanthine/uracil/vitamin C permease (AzgA family)